MDVSNKFLAWLLVIAIVATLIGTTYSINRIGKLGATGYSTEQNATVKLIINQTARLNITATNCDFGNGWVAQDKDYAILASNLTKTDWVGDGTNNSIVVQNLGNSAIVLKATSGKTAATLIGGTSPEYKLWSNSAIGSQGEAGSCTGGEVAYEGTEMDKSAKTMCSNLVVNKKMAIGCYLKVPKDAPNATTSDVVLFQATAA